MNLSEEMWVVRAEFSDRTERTWGPFMFGEDADKCVLALAARPDVLSAIIELRKTERVGKESKP